jgi:hypothetical protein
MFSLGSRAHLLSIVELYLTTGMRENELLRLPVDWRGRANEYSRQI